MPAPRRARSPLRSAGHCSRTLKFNGRFSTGHRTAEHDPPRGAARRRPLKIEGARRAGSAAARRDDTTRHGRRRHRCRCREGAGEPRPRCTAHAMRVLTPTPRAAPRFPLTHPLPTQHALDFNGGCVDCGGKYTGAKDASERVRSRAVAGQQAASSMLAPGHMARSQSSICCAVAGRPLPGWALTDGFPVLDVLFDVEGLGRFGLNVHSGRRGGVAERVSDRRLVGVTWRGRLTRRSAAARGRRRRRPRRAATTPSLSLTRSERPLAAPSATALLGDRTRRHRRHRQSSGRRAFHGIA
ncbi:Protein of unknown function [Gryllus bimaculatus]|nr:Protein of unknown function [Gryllus bimaculatus]